MGAAGPPVRRWHLAPVSKPDPDTSPTTPERQPAEGSGGRWRQACEIPVLSRFMAAAQSTPPLSR